MDGLHKQVQVRQKEMKALARKNNGLIMKLEHEKINLVIDDKSPAKNVLTQAFAYIKKNWDQSKADIMEMVIGLHLDVEESDLV